MIESLNIFTMISEEIFELIIYQKVFNKLEWSKATNRPPHLLQIDSLLKTKKSMERDVCWSEAKTLYCLKSHRKDLIITTTQSHVSADD